MTKIGKPTGLIRFDSQKGITEKTKLRITPRIVAYSVVLFALLGLQGFLITSRNEVEATVLRVPGMLYQEQPEGIISNLYNVKLVNKTLASVPVTLKLEEGVPGEIQIVGGQIIVPEGGFAEAVFFIELPKANITEAKTSLKIEVYSGNTWVETVKTNFLGPVNE
jgi:polyferredoxin